MNQQPQSLLQLPSGSATLFLQEARTHQRLVQELLALYDSWGYSPVHTPLVDYSRAYEGLVSEKDRKRIYHLVDRDGEILMLRWDLTLFLVKQIPSLLAESEGPLRLCYADSILRHQEAEDISRNEFFQTGVELIGRPGPEGELEALLLLHQALKRLGLSARIHIGSRAVFQAAFGHLPEPNQAEIARAVLLRDRAALVALLVSHCPAQAAALEKLFLLIDSPAAAKARIGQLGLPPALAAIANELCGFAEQARALAPDLELDIDLGELGSMSYQSGVVFQAYLAELDTPVASGGRYDRLLEGLGSPAPAVGFSIMLSKVVGRAPLPGGEAALVRLDAGSDFAERYRQAQALRQKGQRVAL